MTDSMTVAIFSVKIFICAYLCARAHIIITMFNVTCTDFPSLAVSYRKNSHRPDSIYNIKYVPRLIDSYWHAPVIGIKRGKRYMVVLYTNKGTYVVTMRILLHTYEASHCRNYIIIFLMLVLFRTQCVLFYVRWCKRKLVCSSVRRHLFEVKRKKKTQRI